MQWCLFTMGATLLIVAYVKQINSLKQLFIFTINKLEVILSDGADYYGMIILIKYFRIFETIVLKKLYLPVNSWWWP